MRGIFALDCILRTLLKGVCPCQRRAVAVDSFLLVEVISLVVQQAVTLVVAGPGSH